jgi:MFS superfamily sulfate permease-like transporter
MSVDGVAGAEGRPVAGHFATLSKDVFAGLVTSLMSVAYGLSFAALIFAPPLTPWIAYGIAATFVTTTISAAIVAVRSSLPFAIAGPDGATAAVTASLVAALIERLINEVAPDDLLAPVMIVLAIVTALTGAALGGYVSCISLSRTTVNYAAGGRGRLCSMVVAAVSALVLTADPGFLAYVPRYVLGGLLLYLGTQLIYGWLVDSARRISPLEYASLLAIALLIIKIGFIAGVLIGVIIGCATFAVSASRVNAIKFSFDGSEYRSSLDWT